MFKVFDRGGTKFSCLAGPGDTSALIYTGVEALARVDHSRLRRALSLGRSETVKFATSTLNNT